MARKSKKSLFNYFKNFDWQESYTSLILGAIIVIILGLLVANYFTKKSSEIGGGEQRSQEQTADQKSANMSEYKVVSGDSLSAISQKLYGTMDNWPVLARVNNIANPNLIYADANLKVPPKEEAVKMREEMTATTYRVNSGDTLFAISEKMYGDGSKWHVIASANNVGYLANGNPLIFAGSTLKVPR